jgi:hypothetical protein
LDYRLNRRRHGQRQLRRRGVDDSTLSHPRRSDRGVDDAEGSTSDAPSPLPLEDRAEAGGADPVVSDQENSTALSSGPPPRPSRRTVAPFGEVHSTS